MPTADNNYFYSTTRMTASTPAIHLIQKLIYYSRHIKGHLNDEEVVTKFTVIGPNVKHVLSIVT